MLGSAPRFTNPNNGVRHSTKNQQKRRILMKSNLARSNEAAMNHRRRRIAPARLVILAVLSLVTVTSLVKLGRASIGTVTKADLSGPWQIALNGNTGCGLVGMLFTGTLNAAGSGTGTLVTHGQCGDSTETGQTLTITSLNSNGSGTANLSCGPACGWNFNIQVSPDRSVFNLVDVSTVNPGNFVAGVAVHQ
jgi:hypothetical protein